MTESNKHFIIKSLTRAARAVARRLVQRAARFDANRVDVPECDARARCCSRAVRLSSPALRVRCRSLRLPSVHRRQLPLRIGVALPQRCDAWRRSSPLPAPAGRVCARSLLSRRLRWFADLRCRWCRCARALRFSSLRVAPAAIAWCVFVSRRCRRRVALSRGARR
jgi:hypothetical protein